jgi:hypothetical protein
LIRPSQQIKINGPRLCHLLIQNLGIDVQLLILNGQSRDALFKRPNGYLDDDRLVEDQGTRRARQVTSRHRL